MILIFDGICSKCGSIWSIIIDTDGYKFISGKECPKCNAELGLHTEDNILNVVEKIKANLRYPHEVSISNISIHRPHPNLKETNHSK